MLVVWVVVKFERFELVVFILFLIDLGEKGIGDMILLCWF